MRVSPRRFRINLQGGRSPLELVAALGTYVGKLLWPVSLNAYIDHIAVGPLPVALAVLLLAGGPGRAAEKTTGVKRYLYVVVPGIRNLLEFGGAGILVFDMDAGHKFVRRIATPASQDESPENIKGVCACAATKKLYFTTLTKLYCVDLVTEKTLWEKALPGGCDRMAITPDGKTLYVPSFEKDHWNVVDGATGDVVAEIKTGDGAHNTVCGPDGKHAYLAGLRTPYLAVVDCQTRKVVKQVGPFGAAIRPFTVNADGTMSPAAAAQQRR